MIISEVSKKLLFYFKSESGRAIVIKNAESRTQENQLHINLKHFPALYLKFSIHFI